MPDAPDGVRITPQPSHLRSMPQSAAHKSSKYLLTLVLLTMIFSAIAVNYLHATKGSVSILVRSVTGERQVYTISIPGGSLSKDMTRDSSEEVSRILRLSDGSSVTVERSGVVLKQPGVEGFRVLVASPVAAAPRTPVALWGDGALLAWVNPGDGSLQVFKQTARGSYAPLYVNRGLLPNSFQFTADGSTLVVAKIVGDTTDIYAVTIESGSIERVTNIDGVATLLP